MKYIIQLLITLYCLPAFGQIPDDFPRLTEDNLENSSIESERTYTAESLFGYMNGGAELYLEYGFDRLVVYEIDIDGNEYKVEVYRMDDPEAAFGIYSVSVFRCDTSGLINDYSCQTDYQLQVCKGKYYISIVNDSGKPEAAGQSIKLAEKLQTLIQGDSFKISAFIEDLPAKEDITKATLIKCELGLYNGAYDWYDILEGVDNYMGLVLEKQDKSDIILKFKDIFSQTQFLETVGIRSRPEKNQEVNIDQNTTLTVISDVVVMIHRLR